MIEHMQRDEEQAPVAHYATDFHGAGPAADGGEPAGPVQRKRRGPLYWLGWVCSMVFIGALIGVGIVGIMKFVNGPVEAGATADSLEAARASTAPRPDMNLLGGKAIELSYPSTFDTVGNRSTVPGAGDQYYLSTKNNVARGIAIAVIGMASGKLDDDSSYKYRVIHPELYKATPVSFGKEQGVLMAKTDNTEQTLFWMHSGKDLNISITSTDPHDNVADLMRVILPTIRWK